MFLHKIIRILSIIYAPVIVRRTENIDFFSRRKEYKKPLDRLQNYALHVTISRRIPPRSRGPLSLE